MKLEATSQMALEVALHGEVRRYMQYDKVPTAAEIKKVVSRGEPANFKEAIASLAILASVPPGVTVEGKIYFWTLAEGLIIKPVVRVPVVISAEDPNLWWNF